MITTIIFDLSEVYLTGLKKTEEYLNAKWNFSFGKTYDHMVRGGLIDFWHGKITEEKFWNKTIELNDWKITSDELKQLVRKNFNEISGTREIIEKLKIKGFKLGLLSVHSKEWVEHCEKIFDYHRLFDSIVYSFEVNVSKPDKKAYEHILKKLNAKPEECLFIDDSMKNLNSAKEMGINIIQFKDSKQLVKDLKKLNIKI